MNADTVAILEGNTFVVSDRRGDMDASPDIPQGLFVDDTRFLSRWMLTVDGRRPAVLSTDDIEYFEAQFFLAPSSGTVYIDAVVSLMRKRTVARGFIETLVVANHAPTPIDIEIRMQADADFADLGDAGWGQWMVDRADVLGTADQRLLDLLIELDEHIDRTEGLGRFIGQIQPVGKDLRSGRPAQAVRLMTMASSKGLTVRAAIVVGVEEGIIPRPSEDLGEERRLLYVAMTRATEYVYLTWSGRRTGPTARAGRPWVARGRNRSPFLTHSPVASEDGDAYLGGVGA